MRFAALAFAGLSAFAIACASTNENMPGVPGSENDAGGDATATGADGSGVSPGDGGQKGSGEAGSGGTDAGGALGPDGDADAISPVGPGSYALNPPKQCDNQFYVPGCTPGNASTACGGTCSAQSACEGTKPNNPDIGFLCPRFILLGDEMLQAAKDDFGTATPFNYAIVGHDPDPTLDQNGSSGTRSCCQCYQLVFNVPNEAEAQVDGKSDGASAVAVPPPLIVQAFNTAAGGGKNFDVYMGAGGFGGNNACDPKFTQQPSPSGKYLYTSFPEIGEGGNGGEKAAILPVCDTSENLITSATLSTAACQSQVSTDCGEIAAPSSAVTAETIQSCVGSNDPSTFYHLNWSVYAKKIECPTHLSEVTGCKLASQNLPAADPTVTTAAQAATDTSFSAGYTTTTMQDCCKPTCAWQDNVVSAGTAVGQYNSFYSCDGNGVPVTE